MHFKAEDYNEDDMTWLDSSGYNRHITSESIVGSPSVVATVTANTKRQIPVLYGNSSDGINFNNPQLPEYTLFHVARVPHNSFDWCAGNIFDGDDPNGDYWVSGWDSDWGCIACAYHGSCEQMTMDKYYYYYSSDRSLSWFVTTDQSNLYRSNGEDLTAPNKVCDVPLPPLTINNGNGNRYSCATSWQVAEMILFDYKLNLDDIKAVELFLARKYEFLGTTMPIVYYLVIDQPLPSTPALDISDIRLFTQQNKELLNLTVTMSSQRGPSTGGEKCVDQNTATSCATSPLDDSPWIAIPLSTADQMSVDRVLVLPGSSLAGARISLRTDLTNEAKPLWSTHFPSIPQSSYEFHLFQNVFPTVPDPYMRFEAINMHVDQGIWIDSSGHGRHTHQIMGNPTLIKSKSNNDPWTTFTAISGGEADRVKLGNPILSNYTMIYVGRYPSRYTNYHNWMFSGPTEDWVTGWENNCVACARHGTCGWITQSTTRFGNGEWFLFTDQANLFRSNGVDKTLSNLPHCSEPLPPLVINDYDLSWYVWEMAEIIIFDSVLSIPQIQIVENYLLHKYQILVSEKHLPLKLRIDLPSILPLELSGIKLYSGQTQLTDLPITMSSQISNFYSASKCVDGLLNTTCSSALDDLTPWINVDLRAYSTLKFDKLVLVQGVGTTGSVQGSRVSLQFDPSTTFWSTTLPSTPQPTYTMNFNFISSLPYNLKPYLHLEAVNYYPENRLWLDSSGNGHHILPIDIRGTPILHSTTANANGASFSFPVVSGSMLDGLKLNNPSLTEYTLIHVARVPSGLNSNLFDPLSISPWSSGWNWNSMGICYGCCERDWQYRTTAASTSFASTSWFITTDTSVIFRSNGKENNRYTRSSLPADLTINSGKMQAQLHVSDWEVAEVMIFDYKLSRKQLSVLELHLQKKYGLNLITPKPIYLRIDQFPSTPFRASEIQLFSKNLPLSDLSITMSSQSSSIQSGASCLDQNITTTCSTSSTDLSPWVLIDVSVYQQLQFDQLIVSSDASSSLLGARVSLQFGATNGVELWTSYFPTTPSLSNSYSFAIDLSRRFPFGLKPVLQLEASRYDPVNKYWFDSSPSGNHISSSMIRGSPLLTSSISGSYGATTSFQMVSSSSSADGIYLDNPSYPKYTLFHVMRNPSYSSYVQIIDPEMEEMWSSGFSNIWWANCYACAFHGSWYSFQPSNSFSYNSWYITSDTPSLLRSNGQSSEIPYCSTALPASLTINSGVWQSDRYRTTNWNIAEILLFDTILKKSEIQFVENYLQHKYSLALIASSLGLKLVLDTLPGNTAVSISEIHVYYSTYLISDASITMSTQSSSQTTGIYCMDGDYSTSCSTSSSDSSPWISIDLTSYPFTDLQSVVLIGASDSILGARLSLQYPSTNQIFWTARLPLTHQSSYAFNLTDFNPRPLMHFEAVNYHPSSLTWYDSSGNGNHISSVSFTGTPTLAQSTSNSFGSTLSFPIVSGYGTQGLLFNNPTLTEYTLIYLARNPNVYGYNPNIIEGVGYNPWTSGFSWNQPCVGCSYQCYRTSWTTSTTLDHNWHLIVDQPALLRDNGRIVGNKDLQCSMPSLSINAGYYRNSYGANSEWEVAEVMIFPRTLLTSEIQTIEMRLQKKYQLQSVSFSNFYLQIDTPPSPNTPLSASEIQLFSGSSQIKSNLTVSMSSQSSSSTMSNNCVDGNMNTICSTSGSSSDLAPRISVDLSSFAYFSLNSTILKGGESLVGSRVSLRSNTHVDNSTYWESTCPVLPSSTRIDFSFQTILPNSLQAYMHFEAKNYFPDLRVWTDSSGNSRHLFSPNIRGSPTKTLSLPNMYGVGSTVFPILQGVSTDGILFRNPKLIDYTLVAVARAPSYPVANIFEGNGNYYWATGWIGDWQFAGGAYHGTESSGYWSTNPGTSAYNWHLIVDESEFLRIDGSQYWFCARGIPLPPLTINSGYACNTWNEFRPWEVAEVIIFDFKLDPNQILAIESFLKGKYLGSGGTSTTNSNVNLIIDRTTRPISLSEIEIRTGSGLMSGLSVSTSSSSSSLNTPDKCVDQDMTTYCSTSSNANASSSWLSVSFSTDWSSPLQVSFSDAASLAGARIRLTSADSNPSLWETYFPSTSDSIYSFNISMTSSLPISSPPYLHLEASKFLPNQNFWIDSSGNNRHIPPSKVRGNPSLSMSYSMEDGATDAFPILTGNSADGVYLTDISIPEYTLFHVARWPMYASRTSIFDGNGDDNWQSGFNVRWNSCSGCVFHSWDSYIYFNTMPATSLHDWFITTDQSVLFRSNGYFSEMLDPTGHEPLPPLTINSGRTNQGGWEVAEVIIFDKTLNLEEIKQMEMYLMNKYKLSNTIIESNRIQIDRTSQSPSNHLEMNEIQVSFNSIPLSDVTITMSSQDSSSHSSLKCLDGELSTTCSTSPSDPSSRITLNLKDQEMVDQFTVTGATSLSYAHLQMKSSNNAVYWSTDLPSVPSSSFQINIPSFSTPGIPYMRFEAANYNLTGSIWYDSSGHDRHIQRDSILGYPSTSSATPNLYGNSIDFPILTGGFSEGINFNNPIFSEYTFIHVARRVSSSGDLFDSSASHYWTSGWSSSFGCESCSYHGPFSDTYFPSFGSVTHNWYLTIDTPDYVRSNGIQTAHKSRNSLPAMTLNAGLSCLSWYDCSQWEVAEVILYNEVLSTSDILSLESYFIDKYQLNNLSPYFDSSLSQYLPFGLSPLLRFEGINYLPNLRTWLDSSGSGLHLLSSNFIGSPLQNTYQTSQGGITYSAVQGGVLDGVLFQNPMMSNYTLVHVARYAGANQGRIFDGEMEYSDWLSGFSPDCIRCAFHGEWISVSNVTSTSFSSSSSPWYITVDTISSLRSNGQEMTLPLSSLECSSLTELPPLTINAGQFSSSQASDWEVAEVMFFDTTLSAVQVGFIEDYLASKYDTPLAEPFTMSQRIFDFNGNDQIWVVPPEVSSVFVEMWGGGGGAGQSFEKGGGGGYTSGWIEVSAGLTLAIRVGGGGDWAGCKTDCLTVDMTQPTLDVNVAGQNRTTTTRNAFGGGGCALGAAGSREGGGGGGGGGGSFILHHRNLFGSPNIAPPPNKGYTMDGNYMSSPDGWVLVAAAGGGGGGGHGGSRKAIDGGAGGGVEGEPAIGVRGIGSGSLGGTQSYGGGLGDGDVTSGDFMLGGSACRPVSGAGGGGGGGYYGGAAGRKIGIYPYVGGGAGGSGYYGLMKEGQCISGIGATPGKDQHLRRSGAGQGGLKGPGSAGRVVLSYYQGSSLAARFQHQCGV